MPRKARLIVPGAVYHVMTRCLEHCRLFPDDTSRDHFLFLLKTCLVRTQVRCYAWVLMDNHYHLVLRLGDAELWEIMKPLNMRYAQYHAKVTGRRGPLFMDRYKSIVTQDQNYIQELVRYVHLNPLRAGICKNLKSLETYKWCGHGALTGKTERAFQNTRDVLRRFGTTDREARAAYYRFLEQGLKEQEGAGDTLVDLVRRSNAGSVSGRKPACWVIGDQKFVSRALATVQARNLRISRFEQEGGGFEGIAAKICARYRLPAESLLKRHRGGPASDVRKVFAWVAAKRYKAPIKSIAEYLGVSPAAVSAMVHAGADVVKTEKIVFE